MNFISVYINKKTIKNKYNFKMLKKGNSLFIFISNQKNKLLLKYILNSNFLQNNNLILFLKKKYIKKAFWHIFSSLDNSINSLLLLQYSFFMKLNVIGLGYKNFVAGNELYLLLGDSNYIILPIPMEIKVICKKGQIYMLGINKSILFNFASRIKLLKKINYYKGKGILEFKNFKFMKLKTGKKQRFM